MKTAPQVRSVYPGEVRNVAIDFTFQLDAGETLSGTPTVSALSGYGVTFSGQQINASAITINGTVVAIGNAVQFTADATSAASGATIRLLITCGTSASQTLKGIVTMVVA